VKLLNFFELNLFYKIFELLNMGEKKQFYLLITTVIIMALLDLVGIAAIMPFIGVISNPQIIQHNDVLSSIFEYLNFSKTKNFILFMGGCFLFLVTISLLFRLFTNSFLIRWAAMREYSLSKRLFECYITQKYSWFLTRNSSDISKSILSEVNTAVYLGIFPAIHILSQGIVVLLLLVMVFFANPIIAIVSFSIFTITYIVVLSLTSKFLAKMGIERLEENKQRFESVSDAFSSFKISKLLNKENFLISKFSFHSKNYCIKQSNAEIASTGPRYLLEGVMVVSTVVGLFYIVISNEDFLKFLPLIVFYGFASMRLLPCVQQILLYSSKLKFGKASIEFIHNELLTIKNNSLVNSKSTISLGKNIQLEGVSFSYDESSSTLENISLEIGKNQCVGLIGKSGSGKTTLVDIIIGLLFPSSGKILIDGNPLNRESMLSWQRTVGYVPQEIYLSDKSIAYNIAFGTPDNEIDMNAVRNAAKIADIADFIESSLPDSYQTFVGERGVRLSGGQKQRIGIARALYNNPQVLVFDEATSSLDTETENVVMESIENLSKTRTIIIIAHRFSTLTKCDNIYYLKKGKIIKQGKYEDLIESKLSTNCAA
jgi:ATP-binding cassette, subfamily B, bacterial PglK